MVPQLTRKISSIQPENVKNYRIVTGGEDTQICFWRYERRETHPLPQMKNFINEEIYCNRDKLAIMKPLQHFHVYIG
jgi:hypothetical protein